MQTTAAVELLKQLEAERAKIWQAYEAGKISRRDYEAYVENGEPPAKLRNRLRPA